MDVDLFFGPGYDMLSLDEMLEGDIKYSVELGLELKENSLSGPGDLATVTDRGTLDWGDIYHSSLDFPGIDTTPGMMVNPKWVIPSLEKTPIKEEPVDIKEEIKSEPEDSIIAEEEHEESNVMCQEEEDDDDEEEEEDEEEVDDDDEEEEDEDQEGDDTEDQDEEPLKPGQTIWNRLLKSAEHQLHGGSIKRTQHVAVQSRHQPHANFIKFKSVDSIIKQQQQHQQQQQLQTSRIIKSPVVSTDSIKKTILVNNVSTQSNHNNIRTIQTIKTKAPIANVNNSNCNNNNDNARSVLVKRFLNIESYPKPAYSYSCLIAMALKNSVTGSLPVSEIYNFMCEHFPYFVSAPSGWKNSVRHNLSLNKCFEKIEKGGPAGSGCRKGCLWAMNPDKISKMDDEVAKWSKKDPNAIRRAMKYPENLEKLERGDLKIGYSHRTIKLEEYGEEDERSEVDEESVRESCEEEDDEEEEEEDERQIESCGGEELDSEDEGEVPPSLRPFDQNNRLAEFSHSRHNSQSASRLTLDLSEEMYEELDLLNQVVSSEEEADLFNVSQAKRPRLQCVLSPVHRQPVRPV
ncbi:hypothetical protein O3M35_001556 [Rhynocoris fuscipes]|uniref:Fork-head domain-containing protein n=1 Tax=Rhynocoris fuscipes TaxID=488301 RepID=A0AAW1CRS5_9HEMI